MILTRERLEALTTDRALGVNFCSYTGRATFPDGSSAVVCTAYAERVIALVGRGEVYGWPENDSALVANGDGHDFAIIDGRWIVDPWPVFVCGEDVRAVFDLFDDADRREVWARYGEPAEWLRRTADGWTPDVPAALWFGGIA